jgi:hypothetical protein
VARPDVHALVKPVVDSYLDLNAEERTEMFEESVIASVHAVSYMVTTLTPQESGELIHIVCDHELSDEQVVDAWGKFWERQGIMFLAHPMYLADFLLIVRNVAQMTRNDISKLVENASPKNQALENMLMNLHYTTLN